MSDRFKKLETAYDRIRTGPDNPTGPDVAWPYSCTDAVNITRYLLKIYHYCEKAYSHIVMIQASVEALEKRLNHMETIANRAMPGPPPPAGPPPPPPDPSGEPPLAIGSYLLLFCKTLWACDIPPL